MHSWPEWRNACVVRAVTIAADIRMVEFAVEGGLPAFGRGALTRVRALDAGAAASAGSHVCVNVGEGRMRVLVAAPGAVRGGRFMWSLVEGARVRLTVPAAADAGPSRQPALPRVAGPAGLRLAIAGGRAAQALPAAANSDPARHYLFF